jgi:CRP-like cAMP-binding protein
MSQPMLVSLERVREHREGTTRRALEAATRAVELAAQAFEKRRAEHRAIEEDIVATWQRPYRQGAGGGAAMLTVQLSISRVELLREHLVRAHGRMTNAQAELADKQLARAQALAEHLRACHKREAVQDQISRAGAEAARLSERAGQDAALDMAAARSARANAP